jgi:SAM-dependent methyltransferase
MTFEEMQRGELDWWRAWLAQPHGLARILALYGYRYLAFFFEEFSHLGSVGDFGSGPVSAAYIGDPAPARPYCIDPLMNAYQDAGLIYGEPAWWGLPPDPFDTALLLNVLDHCEDPAALIRDAAGSLVSGGAALIWLHVDQKPDRLHRLVRAPDVVQWVRDAGLQQDRSRLRVDGGPTQFMVKAVKP